MATNTLVLGVPRVDVGLNTSTFTVPATVHGGAYNGAGLYNAQVQCTEVPPTGLSIVVNQNGSPVYTAPTQSLTQSAIQFKTKPITCAIGDVITVVLSSSAGEDLLLNTVKSNVAINQGA